MRPYFSSFYSHQQVAVLVELVKGEEAAAIVETVNRVNKIIAEMPTTGQTEDPERAKTIELLGGDPDDHVVYLHYFIAGCDWWIIEKDVEDGVSQAFGYACMNDPEMSELGYISITEITDLGAEMDLYWEPKLLSVVKKELFGRGS
ncbi:MAG TPA: hypothetical protein VIG24_16300 [Acidimicrobiia bacterium]